MTDDLFALLLVMFAGCCALGGALLLIQVLAARGLLPGCSPAPARGTTVSQRDLAKGHLRPTALVIIPAHNEELGLGDTLNSVMPQLAERDRVLVVADNCSDATAKIAEQLGAQVVQREDAGRRGKGYALDFGARHVETWAELPDVVVVVDADCRLDDGALGELVDAVVRSGRASQALYLMHGTAGASLRVRMAEFAWKVKNQVRPRGMLALGWPCPLMGSGMAFPWDTFRQAPLANGDLVEDMRLGSDLALQGRPPQFCERAVVRSEFPTSQLALKSQRHRWEAGHLSVIRRYGLRLFVQGLRRRELPVIMMALDLSVPPLALLAGLQVLALVAASISVAVLNEPAAWAALALALLGMCALAVAVVMAWSGWARHLVQGAELATVPGYILRKIPIYVAALAGRPGRWVRTARKGE